MGYRRSAEKLDMKNYKNLIYALFCIFISACASSTYQITSTPTEASIDVTYANGTKKNLGKTPLSGNSSVVNPTKQSFTVEITKENFEKQQIFVPDSTMNKEVTLNVVLAPSAQSGEARKTDEQVNNVAANVADIQRDIQSKNYDIALSKINRGIAENPGVATFYSLSGNVHYLEKRLDKALISYKRALDLNPKSTELAKIIDKLEGMKGGTR